MRVTLDDIRTREQQHVLQTYKRQPVAFVRGQGSRLYDADGREYLDLLSGIGVTSLGHAHPGLAAVITEQASTLLHTSNLYYHPFQARGGGPAGAAVRPAAHVLLQQRHRGQRGVPEVRAPLLAHAGREGARGLRGGRNGFAGRTMGALSVTHDPHYREPFMPLIGPVTFVDPEKPETLLAAVGDTTAAIIAEPIRGEGGIRTLPEGFVRAVTDVTAKTGTLLIADEVQSGLGRTGYGFYFQALGWKPDLVSVGKALGSGVPVAAALISEKVAGAISAGDHGTTYGGNLLSCRAAAVLPRAVDGPRAARARPGRGRALRAPAPRAGAEAPGDRRGARRRPDARAAARRSTRRRSWTARAIAA